MFFFAAVTFSFGNLLYSTLCPSIIRYYSRFSDFTAEGKGGPQIVQFFSLLALKLSLGVSRDQIEDATKRFLQIAFLGEGKFNEVQADSNRSRDKKYKQYLSENQEYIEDFVKDTTESSEERMSNIFWLVHGYADRWYPLARLVCGAFYLTGFVLTSIVVFQNIGYVLQVASPQGG